jgi:hypothetical protein
VSADGHWNVGKVVYVRVCTQLTCYESKPANPYRDSIERWFFAFSIPSGKMILEYNFFFAVVENSLEIGSN